MRVSSEGRYVSFCLPRSRETAVFSLFFLPSLSLTWRARTLRSFPLAEERDFPVPLAFAAARGRVSVGSRLFVVLPGPGLGFRRVGTGRLCFGLG